MIVQICTVDHFLANTIDVDIIKMLVLKKHLYLGHEDSKTYDVDLKKRYLHNTRRRTLLTTETNSCRFYAHYACFCLGHGYGHFTEFCFNKFNFRDEI